ncbi:MAG: MFS transporter [Alphaproteobacteria bacterium]|nr:MFS transporter [Alphaproteobacteria bacterium]
MAAARAKPLPRRPEEMRRSAAPATPEWPEVGQGLRELTPAGQSEITRTMTATAPSLGRDAGTMGLIGSAHFLSHFFQMALPPLFPILKADLGVSYTALGGVMTVFFAASGLTQAASGFLVDRFGARRVLLGGLTLLAAATGLMGLAGTYWALLPLAALAGFGNSVFHPADLSILTNRVSPHRLGRAYGVHTIGGSLGYAASPVLIVTLAGLWHWRLGLVIASLIGLGAAVAIWRLGRELADDGSEHRRSAGGAPPPLEIAASIRMLLSPTMLVCFGYFMLVAMAAIGIQTAAVPVLLALYDLPLAAAAGNLTGFLLGSVIGILAGGILADRTARHDLLAAIGLVAGAALMLAVGSGALPVWTVMGAMIGAGASSGFTMPPRDLLVRAATPAGASGRVFGFVYSGLDLGASLTPFLFGMLLDHGEPRVVFLVLAGLYLATILTLIQVRRAGDQRARGAAAARPAEEAAE